MLLALFSILGDLENAAFLDLFAGSGAIGIEALSRGAKEVVFVEQNPQAVTIIKENLRHTKLLDYATIISKDVLTGINMIENQFPFDIIFMDPPYKETIVEDVLGTLIKTPLVGKDTVIIVEAAKTTSLINLESLNFQIEKIKEYKSNKHIFLKMLDKNI